MLQIRTTHNYQTMIIRPWRFYFLPSAKLDIVEEAGRLFERGSYGVDSTYTGMWKHKVLEPFKVTI